MSKFYDSIVSLDDAMAQREIIRETVYALHDKGVLGVFDQQGEIIFQRSYASLAACKDICLLLGIDMQDVSEQP